MTPDRDSSLARFTEAAARAQSHWRARRRQAVPPETYPPTASGITIALAREAGSPGTPVAHALGQRLGWPVYDHELLERIAHELGLRVSLLESVDEKRRTWLQECVEMFADVPLVSASTYVQHLLETMLSLAAHGECIIVGRGAAQILPFETTLRIRLVAPLQDRILAMSRHEGIPWAEAARRVEEVDRERVRFIKDHFRKDSTDPRHYDLIVNSARWSVAECAELIIEALHRLQARKADNVSEPVTA